MNDEQQITAPSRRLYRDPKHACIGGVCAGIAESLDIDILLARVTAIVMLFLTAGLAALVYLALWMVLPVKVTEGSIIDIEPRRVRSERYGRVIDAHGEEIRSKRTGERKEEAAASASQHGLFSKRVQQDLGAYRFSFALFLVSTFVVTLVIIVALLVTGSMGFGELVPFYFIPLGILLVSLPRAPRSRTIRICIMLLCFEACVVCLPFSMGFLGYEDMYMQGPTFLTWIVGIILLFAAIIFENAPCYLLTVLLIFMAIIVSFYDFGLFDSTMALTSVVR